MPKHPLLIIAHRGASATAPENTRAAIRNALAMQADLIELDAQLTRDDRVVMFHDERLERTTSGRGVLARWRYRELARLDCGAWFAPRFAGERMLLMSQALRLVPAPRQVNLELKRTTRPAALVRQVARCLRWTRMVSRVLVSSFEPELLARLRALHPRVRVALLCRQTAHAALRQAATLGCVALHPQMSLITPSLVAHAHAAGLRIHAWTVDRRAELIRLWRLGVDGVVTNVPDRVYRWRSGS